MAYSIFFNKKVKKLISELNQSQKDRIKEKLLSFAENPFNGDIKKIKEAGFTGNNSICPTS